MGAVCRGFLGVLNLTNGGGQPTPLLFVPGNHNVSFAIVRPDGLFPEVDATAMVELYNRTMRPAVPRTKATYRYVTDQVFSARDFGGVHCVFLSVGCDGAARLWMAAELKRVPASMPALLFAHNPPKVGARHFTAPRRAAGGSREKIEAVIGDVDADAPAADGPAEIEQRQFAMFLKALRNIVGPRTRTNSIRGTAPTRILLGRRFGWIRR